MDVVELEEDEVLVDLEDRRLVAAAVAVVGRAKDCYDLVVSKKKNIFHQSCRSKSRNFMKPQMQNLYV